MKSVFKNRRSSKTQPITSSRLFAFTLHENNIRWPTPYNYLQGMNGLMKEYPNINIMSYKYEVGKLTSNCQSGKLHVHGVIHLLGSMPYLKGIIPGMNLQLKPLVDYEGWDEYLGKQKREEIDNYLIAHFWDMDLLEYDFDNKHRYSNPINTING